MSNFKSTTIHGFKWDLMGKFITHGFTFVISIALARLLSPREFGLLGMSMAFITITETLTAFGLNSSLIYRKTVVKSLYDSVFILFVFIGIIFYCLFYATAPLISLFFKLPELTELVRILSIVLIFNSLVIVPQTILVKQIRFKEINLIAIGSSVLSSGLALVLAMNNFGVYSLIYQQIFNSFLLMLFAFIVSRYKPSWFISKNKIGALIPFGKNLYLSHIIYIFYTRIDSLIIGKLFSPSILGYYYRSFTFSNLAVQYSSGSLSSILFPAIAKIQDDKEKIRMISLNIFMVLIILMFFLTGLIHLLSKDIILFLFTEKWLASVHILQMLIISVITFPICVIFENTIKGLGHSRTILTIEILKKTIGIIILISTALISFETFLYGIVFSSFINLFISWHFTLPILEIKKMDVIKTMSYKLLLVSFCYFVTYNCIAYFEFPLYRLICGGTIFTLLYYSIQFIIFRKESMFLFKLIFPNKTYFF